MARASKPSCDQEEKAERLADNGPDITTVPMSRFFKIMWEKQTPLFIVKRNYSKVFLLLVAKHIGTNR